MFRTLRTDEDFEVQGLSDNSQMIKPGYVFICKKGSEKDGADYAAEAVDNGAAAIVSYRTLDNAEKPVIVADDLSKMTAELAKKYYFPGEKTFKLIGVTGTNGKTTVTHLVRDILIAQGGNVGIIGTNGVFLNDERVGVETNTPTTPNPIELWKIFAKMRSMGAAYVIMEVSSHALVQKRVWGCEFDVGIFTNLTRDHLDFHKTFEEYKRAKALLFPMCKECVINIDDPTGARYYSDIKGKKLSVGFHDADLEAAVLKSDADGSEFILEYKGKKVRTNMPLCGRFNVYNMLTAVGACISLGLDFKKAADALKNVKPVLGRMEKIDTGRDFSVIIDYAHTPDGLEKIIHTAKGFSKGRVITVFGCGGDRDKTKRPIMGEIAGRYSDYTVITSDNPRCEDPLSIICDIYEGIKATKGEYCIVPDRKMAIAHAISLAKKNDVILLAGKGQETYQIIGHDKFPFDERKIVTECILKSFST